MGFGAGTGTACGVVSGLQFRMALRSMKQFSPAGPHGHGFRSLQWSCQQWIKIPARPGCARLQKLWNMRAREEGMRDDLATSAAGGVAPTAAPLTPSVEVTAAAVAVLGCDGGSVLCATASNVLFSCLQAQPQPSASYKCMRDRNPAPRTCLLHGVCDTVLCCGSPLCRGFGDKELLDAGLQVWHDWQQVSAGVVPVACQHLITQSLQQSS